MKEQFLNLSGLIDLVTYIKLCIAQHKVIIPRASFSLFPETGDENNIYIDTSTNAIYRWNDTDKKFVLLAKPPRTIAISEGTNNGEITLKVDNIASNAKVHGLTSTAFTELNKFATAAQGAKADSAVQTITLSSGTKNGTIKIKVNNITTDNIEVAGLGSAAFSDIGIFAAKSHTHKKDEVGLGNVDNTADIDKSVKYATSAGAVSWKNITDKPTLFPPQQHNHDSLYYRKNEVDSLLSSKSDTGHTHVQFIQEVKFSNGTYSDPLNGTAVAIKASGGIAADLIYEGGKTLADKYQAKGSYASENHSHNYAGSSESGGAAYNATNLLNSTPTLSIGCENNEISIKTNDNGLLNNFIGGDYASIRSALDFRWYDSHWQIGNIRSGTDKSYGFGFAFSPDGINYTKLVYIDVNGYIHGNLDGYATTALSVPWSGITDKPSTFAPSSHNHTIANITNLQATLDGKAASSHTHSQYLTSHQDISGKFNKSGDTITGGTIAMSSAGLPTLNGNSIAGSTTAIGKNGIGISGIDTKNDGAAIFMENTASENNHLIIALGDDATSGVPDNDYIAFRYYDTQGNVTYQSKVPAKSGTIALTSDIPTSLKNPNSLTITVDGGDTGSISADAYDGSAAKSFELASANHDHNNTYLKLSGGALSGPLIFANGTYNTVGDDVAIGDINIAGTLGVKGANGTTAIRLVPYNASTTSGTNCPGVSWTCTGDGASNISGILSGTFSGQLSGSATSVPWSGVTDKPSTYTPSSHTHTKSQITDFPTSLPASDVYSWAKASSKPSYSWSEITGKPGTFTPSSHTHSKSEVGLSNVDNTSDSSKSVKYATSSANADTVDSLHASDFFRYKHLDSALDANGTLIDDCMYVVKSSISNGAHTNHSAVLNISNIGTPFQIQIADSSIMYLYKRYKSSGKWTDWSKMSAGYADSAGSVAWGNVSGRPTSLPASDVYAWAKASTKPSYSYTEITNRPTLIKAVSKNGYWGMADHDGSDSNWIRTTTSGIIPYQSGGAGAGHCGIGTSSWYFSNAYIDTVNCVNASVSGHIDVGGYIQSSNLINTYFEYQSNRGSVDWRFGAATGTSDENFFGFYDAKTGKIPLALDGNFGNIYVGFNVGSYESPTAVGVYLGGQVAGNRAFIYNGDAYQGSIWIQTRLDGSWKWFSLGRVCSTALSDIRLKGNIRDTEVEDATKVIESMKIRSFERKDSHKKYKIGFIADELEQLDPNLVDGGGEVDGHPYYKSVNNLQMLAYVVKGMQELNSKVTILEQENKRLKQKLNMCN